MQRAFYLVPKRGLIVLAIVLLAMACDRPPVSSPTEFAVIGGRRSAVMESLKLAGGRPLVSSADVLMARVFSRDLGRPMNVELKFKEDTLFTVTYWQPPPERDWVCPTPVGVLGYRRFMERTQHPPLKDQYLYFGPFGQLYVGADGTALRPTKMGIGLGAFCILAVLLTIALNRRKAHR